jgi:hypothetical protein
MATGETILLMVIGVYFRLNYHKLLMIIIGYYIDYYWWLLMVILLVVKFCYYKLYHNY